GRGGGGCAAHAPFGAHEQRSRHRTVRETRLYARRRVAQVLRRRRRCVGDGEVAVQRKRRRIAGYFLLFLAVFFLAGAAFLATFFATFLAAGFLAAFFTATFFLAAGLFLAAGFLAAAFLAAAFLAAACLAGLGALPPPLPTSSLV